MAVSLAATSSRQCLADVNPDGSNPFIEKLLVQIYKHFDGHYLIDVTFKLTNPGALVTAHRLILSAASSYFKELFQSGAGIRPLIEITDIDSDTFERLITFCYTGKALITKDNIDRMLKAAMKLQLNDAVADCVDFLIDHISDYTLERAYALEREAQCELLSEKILEHEIGNFMSVIQTSDVLNFVVSKLQTILESDDLNVPMEKDAFEVVKRWNEHDTSGREQDLPDITSCLRLTQFDTNFIMTNIQRAAQNLIWEESFLALSMDGTLQQGISRSIFQYNKTEDLWQKWVDIEINIENFHVILVDDNLVFIGGERRGKIINEVRSWNFRTKTFQQLPAMNQPRRFHCAVKLDDKIYAIGGMGVNDEYLQSVEMYSISNGWKSVNSMSIPRAQASAVVLNGKIYVIGGYGESCCKSVECYDPTTDCWTQCADMNEGLYYRGAAVHNGQIFVVGGYINGKNSSTVERYDPQINEWTKIYSRNIKLQYVCCISIDNQLWAVGGFSEGHNVSVYDEQNDKWMNKKQMPISGRYYCFSVPKVLISK